MKRPLLSSVWPSDAAVSCTGGGSEQVENAVCHRATQDLVAFSVVMVAISCKEGNLALHRGVQVADGETEFFGNAQNGGIFL